MDPVSILGTVTGVASAAAELSISLYGLASQIKHAPQEMIAIAEEMQSFSGILTTLQNHLSDHEYLFKPKVFEDTRSIVLRLKVEQEGIERLTGSKKTASRLRWVYKKSEIAGRLYRIQALKSSLNVVLQVAAMQASLHCQNVFRQDPPTLKNS